MVNINNKKMNNSKKSGGTFMTRRCASPIKMSADLADMPIDDKASAKMKGDPPHKADGTRAIKNVREAKRMIRRGQERKKVQDDFGNERGYDSKENLALDASRIVQRKLAQETRSLGALKKVRGGANWAGEEKFGKYGNSSETFTKKEGKEIYQQLRKSRKQSNKTENKDRKKRAKTTRESMPKGINSSRHSTYGKGGPKLAPLAVMAIKMLPALMAGMGKKEEKK